MDGWMGLVQKPEGSVEVASIMENMASVLLLQRKRLDDGALLFGRAIEMWKRCGCALAYTHARVHGGRGEEASWEKTEGAG